MNRTLALATLVCLALFRVPAATAAWPYEGLRSPFGSLAVDDPNGGTTGIYVELVSTSPLTAKLYVQSIDDDGETVHPGYGIEFLSSSDVSPEIPNAYALHHAIDGSIWILGAAIEPSGASETLIVQRVTPEGNLAFARPGIPIAAPSSQSLSDVAMDVDAAGNLHLAWRPYSATSSHTIYAQSITPSGGLRWGAGRTAASFVGDYPSPTALVPDDAGGVMLFWSRGVASNYGVYGQAISSGGTVFHGLGGAVIEDKADGREDRPVAIRTGDGRAFVAYADNKAYGTDFDNRVQVVQVGPTMNAESYSLFGSDDVDPGFVIEVHDMMRLGAGVVVLWSASGVGAYIDAYNGAGAWTATEVSNGSSVVTNDAFLASDGLGGVYVCYETSPERRAHLQRYDFTGRAVFGPGGIDVGGIPRLLASHPTSGAAYVMSYGGLDGISTEATLQRFEREHGGWGKPEPEIVNAVDVPNDEGGHVLLQWTPSSHDAAPETDVVRYSVWRSLNVLPRGATIVDATGYRAAAERGERVFRQAAQGFWELVDEVPALRRPGYSLPVTTLADSTPGTDVPHEFQVLAHTYELYVYWESNVVAASSTDDLAPSSPAALAASRESAGVVVEWPLVTAADLSEYRVYRAVGSTVEPEETALVASTVQLSFLDDTASLADAYAYVVTAVDVHGNESGPSPIGTVSGATAAPAGAARGLAIEHVAPNPFNPRTTIAFTLDRAMTVQAEVFDLAGRRVRTLLGAQALAAGEHRVTWQGDDDAGRATASGNYFLRLTGDGVPHVERLTLLK